MTRFARLRRRTSPPSSGQSASAGPAASTDGPSDLTTDTASGPIPDGPSDDGDGEADRYVPRRARPRRRRRRHPALWGALAVALVLGLALARGVTPVTLVARITSSPLASGVLGDASGGTLTVLSQGPVLAWDPQRIATRETTGFASRVYLRTLTAYTAPKGGAPKLVGDLATDTGHPNKDLTAWTFTLRPGVSWQDGSPITCKDVAYGVSRSFAKQITGGPSYALAYLDVPKKADGTTTYPGPYATGAAATKGQQAFDKAVTCSGRSITFHLSEPVADFPGMVSLPAFAPFKKSQDHGKASLYDAFSSGPYELQGKWTSGTGGTWVRNPHWKASSDPIRTALPDEIDFREGLEPQSIAQTILQDRGAGRAAISLEPVPPVMLPTLDQIGDVSSRSVDSRSQLTDYLAPNLKSTVFAKQDARLALALATNRTAYVHAVGGTQAAEPAYSLLGPTLPSHTGKDALGSGPYGDPARAKALLKKAGFTLPVKITVAYRASPTSSAAIQALAADWERAGFKVTAKAISKDYFATIATSGAATTYDVMWANWASDWPSASTVLPPLFDSRINLSSAGSGRDYGHVDDSKLNSMMTTAGRTGDQAKRIKEWRAADDRLLQAGDYIPLAQRRGLYLAGSDIRHLEANEVYGGVVDLAEIGVR